jgi:EAL domain-containing protein (putative c-di-GMP-specific phosphodiesterase class I)
MAHSLGLKTVAEGVENAALLTYLREQQCDEAQGYLFSKPLPPEEIETVFRQLFRPTG